MIIFLTSEKAREMGGLFEIIKWETRIKFTIAEHVQGEVEALHLLIFIKGRKVVPTLEKNNEFKP